MARFIAAMDHSGGSTGGVLERYGQEYTEADKMDKVHAMRMRMINSPDFNDKNIWAAIVYKDSVDRGIVDVLRQKCIMTYLKIDSGCNKDGTLKQFPVKQMIAYAKDNGCIGTKMRSIVTTIDILEPILQQQFQLAETIYNAGLMPIIEPEIPIDHPKKDLLEKLLNIRLRAYLANYTGMCILKLTLPEEPDQYLHISKSLKVHKLVGLSGGYDNKEACDRLALNNNMTASFSRALSENLYYNDDEQMFDIAITQNINNITRASSED
jgi:fructose-bisphosphate aldolase class I